VSGEGFNVFRILQNAHISYHVWTSFRGDGNEQSDLPWLDHPLPQTLYAGVGPIQEKQETVFILLR